MTQSDARTAGFAERQGHLGDRNHIQPFHPKIMGELTHVALLVDDTGIQHIIDRRALALRSTAEHLAECGKILASGAAGGFDEQLGHVDAFLVA